MRLTDIFKFKLFDRTDKADLDVVNENFQNVETALNNCKQDLSNHKSSGDHDSRYYTETEMDGKLSGKSDTTHNHDSRYLQKSAVINSNTVTEAGYALDARQANPNVSGTLGAQINSLNRTFTQRISELNTNLSNFIKHNYISLPVVTIEGNSYKDVKYSFSVPDGYKILTACVGNSGSQFIYPFGVQWSKEDGDSTIHFYFQNSYSSQISTAPFVIITLVKNM